MHSGPFREEDSLEHWLDRHHVEVIRTHATTLDGMSVGKFVHRRKFLKTLPNGHGVADQALAMDPTGMPHLAFWNDFRQGTFGDICLKPDLDTLMPDGIDPDLGHCITDYVLPDGSEIALCPRTMLRKVLKQIDDLGFQVKASFELEFHLFEDSYADARRKQYKDLIPVSASMLPVIYSLRNIQHSKRFMGEVTKRLTHLGIQWEGWNDEVGLGQIELNLEPTDPIHLADSVVRTRQVIYETAMDLGLSATFMAKPKGGAGSGMHMHHSLLKEGEPAFFDATRDDNHSSTLTHWLGGLMATLPATVSYLCPSINSYRRFVDFSGPPMTVTWGEENKSTALRLVTRSAKSSRVEHRVGAADLNPYLALAVVLAGGLAGLRSELQPPPEFTSLAWRLPEDAPRLPMTISAAGDALRADTHISSVLGQEVVDYWLKTRRQEWLSFNNESGESGRTTDWEFYRYFEAI